jgi:hypothetical protein
MSGGNPMPNGLNRQFVNWYFHAFTGDNPFGFSSSNLGRL